MIDCDSIRSYRFNYHLADWEPALLREQDRKMTLKASPTVHLSKYERGTWSGILQTVSWDTRHCCARAPVPPSFVVVAKTQSPFWNSGVALWKTMPVTSMPGM